MIYKCSRKKEEHIVNLRSPSKTICFCRVWGIFLSLPIAGAFESQSPQSRMITDFFLVLSVLNEQHFFNVKNCRITLDDVQYVIPPDNAEAKRTKVEEGDLLISITADLGRTGVITKEIADHGAYINQHLTCIRLDRKALHPLYVAYYMESEAGKTQFQLKNQNGVKAGLNFNAINSLNLMVPPLEKQNCFVDFVAKVERQKLTIQQSLDKLEVMKKSLMQEYFG